MRKYCTGTTWCLFNRCYSDDFCDLKLIIPSRYRDSFSNRVLAPESELLSFAPPKESGQRKGGPVAAHVLRSSHLSGAAEWASCPSAAVRHPCRTPSGYSRQILRCSTRQTGESALLRNISLESKTCFGLQIGLNAFLTQSLFPAANQRRSHAIAKHIGGTAPHIQKLVDAQQ